MTEQLEEYTGSNHLISEDATKAKNKLMAVSFITIFYIIFEPSLTGSLSLLSVKINSHYEYIPLFIILVINWLLLRFIFLLINSNDDISLAASNPLYVLKALYRNNYTSSSTELETEKADLESKQQIFHEQYGNPPHEAKITNPNIIDKQHRDEKEYERVYVEYCRQKRRLNDYVLPDLEKAKAIDSAKSKSVIGLIAMDFATPIVFALLAMLMVWLSSDMLVINFAT